MESLKKYQVTFNFIVSVITKNGLIDFQAEDDFNYPEILIGHNEMEITPKAIEKFNEFQKNYNEQFKRVTNKGRLYSYEWKVLNNEKEKKYLKFWGVSNKIIYKGFTLVSTFKIEKIKECAQESIEVCKKELTSEQYIELMNYLQKNNRPYQNLL